MWLRLIFGGFVTAVGLSLFISVCITPISPRCVRFYGALSLALLLAGVLLLVRGLKEYAGRLKSQ